MKRLALTILIIILVLSICGCSNDSPDANEPSTLNETSGSSDDEALALETLAIYDNNNLIDKIDCAGSIKQTDDGIVYSKYSDESTASSIEMEYYRYIFDTKENIKLGSVKGWSLQSHEAAYIDNHIYFFACTGNAANYDDRTLKFLEINLNDNSMTEIASEPGGFPFDSLAVQGNRLLRVKVSKNGSSLVEYDPQSGETNTLLNYDFNDENVVGNAIRKLSVDETKKTISLLILDAESEKDVSLRMDIYDYDMNLLDTVDVSAISDDSNELRQGVSFFEYSNDYFYYENYSITRYLGQVKNDGLEQIEDIDETFAKAFESVKNDEIKLFYQPLDQNNYIYLFDTKDGSMKKAAFKADDERYNISSLYRDENNNLFIFMYYKDPDTGEKLESRLYYINQSDLNFE